MSENNTNNNFNHEDESSLKLSDLWNLIWGHKWWYVLALIVAVSCAVFYLYRTPTTYSSTAKVLVDESNQDATMRNLGVASAGMMRLRSFNSVENEIEAFSSVDYMQKVVERLGLQTTYIQPLKLKSVDLATNSPVQLVLAGENPHTSFKFDLTRVDENHVKLSNMMIKDEPIGEAVEVQLCDTVATALGRLAIFPTEYIENFETPIEVK